MRKKKRFFDIFMSLQSYTRSSSQANIFSNNESTYHCTGNSCVVEIKLASLSWAFIVIIIGTCKPHIYHL